MKEFINTMFGFLVMGLMAYGSFKFVIYAKGIECNKWGGVFHWTTGCVMETNGVRITLADYKEAQAASITKPIPTNANINLGIIKEQ